MKPQEQEDMIQEKLAASDVQIVGNNIFSRFRELTHWCDCGYDPVRAEYFFPKAFIILEKNCAIKTTINHESLEIMQ